MEQFEMEELIPILTELTEKYTSFDSTSVTYEIARQLMGAVLYCINEAESAAGERGELTEKKPTARMLYDRGRILLLDKAQAAKKLYEELLINFETYGVLCYKETILDGMPAFFKNYDVRYNPQEHLLTLDYPIMGGFEELRGIDLIYSYLERVFLEQAFLSNVPKDYVKQVLVQKYGSYRDLFINPCQETMRSLILQLFIKDFKNNENMAEAAGEVSSGAQFAAALRKSILDANNQELKKRIMEKIHILSGTFSDKAERMEAYLLMDASDFSTELMLAAELGTLDKLLVF